MRSLMGYTPQIVGVVAAGFIDASGNIQFIDASGNTSPNFVDASGRTG